VSLTNPPGGPGEPPDDDRQRRQRANVRRSRRADSTDRRTDDSDPYGWSAARDGGVDYPPAPPGEQPRAGHPDRDRSRAEGARPEFGRPDRGRPAAAGPDQWSEAGRGDPRRADPRQADPRQADPRQGDPRQGDYRRGDPREGSPRQADPRQGDPRQAVDPRGAEARRSDPRRAEPMMGDPTRVAVGGPPGEQRRESSFFGDGPADGRSAGRGGPDEAGRSEQRGRRLRGPHRRRAVDGQQTGLAPSMQSDLPSWLQERGVGVAPLSRLLSLSAAGFAGLLGLALVLGAYAGPGSYALVVFGVQLLLILAWTVTMRPAGPRLVAGVALGVAAAADLAAALPAHASLAPLGLVTVAAFGAGVVAQLLRPSPRPRVTESLGGTLLVVVGVVCFAMLIVLSRHAPGTPAIAACLVAAGVALVVARLADTVLPSPRTSPQVPRGSIGVVLGAMAGTVAASVVGSLLVGLHPPRAALAGFATAVVAVLADLAISYAEAGREPTGTQPTLWVARHMQGPLGGFALAAPVAYVLSVMFLVTLN
jgi:hypothetical protein